MVSFGTFELEDFPAGPEDAKVILQERLLRSLAAVAMKEFFQPNPPCKEQNPMSFSASKVGSGLFRAVPEM